MLRSFWLGVFGLGALAACSADRSNLTAPYMMPSLAKGGGGDLAVTSVVADADANVAPALQIRSDGLGAYQNSSALSSIIQTIGAWVLDSRTPRGGTRTLYLDFGRPIPATGPGGGDPIAVPNGLYRVRAIAKCNAYGSSMLTLAPGSSMPCPLHVAFTSGGVDYAVQMNPSTTGANPDGAPETDYVTITCTAPTSGFGPCVQWRITPSGSSPAELRNVARLIKYVSAKGNTTLVNQGNFYFSFALTVTSP